MADEMQHAILRSGIEAWNEWRGQNPDDAIDLSRAELQGAKLCDARLSFAHLNAAKLSDADLSGATLNGATLRVADLGDASLIEADLRGANLSGANLSGANLHGADLQGADLQGANLTCSELSGVDLRRAKLNVADLSGADLRGANLRGANLRAADLRNTDLGDANLSGANLLGTNLLDATLHGADLRNAELAGTLFSISSLASIEGLAEVYHRASSSISTSALESTAVDLTEDVSRQGQIEAFYRGAGVPEHLIEYYRTRIGAPIEFYSCFISYSHSDKTFARRLYADLQAGGIRCWLDEKDLRGGDLILDVVNQAIRRHDKLILCCSLASLTSSWVERELQAAFDREARSDERILIPLDLDGYLFDGYEETYGPQIRARYAIPLDGWSKDAALYDAGFEATLKALRPR